MLRTRRSGWPRAATPDGPCDATLRRQRHSLVVILTFVTGCADATGFLALGGAFSSVMTGNMVLLGLSAGTADTKLATNSGLAIASYIVGVLVGAHVAGVHAPHDSVWPRSVTRALTLELIALLSLLVAWELTLSNRSPHIQLSLLMIAAAALGIQSSAIQRFGVPGLSSTYLTGTLTVLIGGVAARHPLRSLLPSAQVLSALVTGAAVGALVVMHLSWLSPILLVVPLASVVTLSTRLRRNEAGKEVDRHDRRARPE